MKLLDIFTLLAQIATAVSVIIAVISIRAAVKANRRQMNVQVLMADAQRYERILESFPPQSLQARFSTADLPPESDQLTQATLRYLNLCSEEFYLWRAKYIEDGLWEIWEQELRRMLQSNLLMREWVKIESEFQSYPEFYQFVKRVQAERA